MPSNGDRKTDGQTDPLYLEYARIVRSAGLPVTCIWQDRARTRAVLARTTFVLRKVGVVLTPLLVWFGQHGVIPVSAHILSFAQAPPHLRDYYVFSYCHPWAQYLYSFHLSEDEYLTMERWVYMPLSAIEKLYRAHHADNLAQMVSTIRTFLDMQSFRPLLIDVSTFIALFLAVLDPVGTAQFLSEQGIASARKVLEPEE